MRISGRESKRDKGLWVERVQQLTVVNRDENVSQRISYDPENALLWLVLRNSWDDTVNEVDVRCRHTYALTSQPNGNHLYEYDSITTAVT